MRKWLRRTLFVAILAALLVTWWQARRGPSIPSGSYVVLSLAGSYPDVAPDHFLARVFLPREATLFEVLLDLRKAKVDPRIRGIVLRIGSLEIGWGKAAELRQAVVDFRKSGKLAVALIEQEFTPGNMAHFIASACDRVYLVPGSSAPLSGLAANYLFFGGVWEKLNIEMTVEKRAEYKTAGDMIANKAMTPAHREMANSILDSLSAEFFEGLALSRSVSVDRLKQIVETEAPSAAEELVAHGIIDGSQHWEELRQELGGKDARFTDEATYRRVPPEAVGLQTGPTVALIFAAGQIVTGESRRTPSGMLLGADTIREALQRAAENELVRAIVVRVDSPGGSALASEMIWRTVREAAKAKPVVVSMSDVAASGGYYASVGATKIVAQPTTLTGSIGVVLARPAIAGFLDRLGIHAETIARGRFATLDDVTTSLDAAQKARLGEEVDRTYQLFLQRVAEGRGLAFANVQEVARGRVWTGAQALANELVDRLGGLFDAVELAKELAGIPREQEVRLLVIPPPQGLWTQVEEMVTRKAHSLLPLPVREALSTLPAATQAGPFTLLPYAIDVR